MRHLFLSLCAEFRHIKNEKEGEKVSVKKQKTFRFSDVVLKKIAERNRGLYPYETQYIEAAILAFDGMGGTDTERFEELKKRLDKLEHDFYESKKENQKEMRNDIPRLPDIGIGEEMC